MPLARLATLVLALLATPALGGCALLADLEPRAAGPLVTVERHGGLCPEGECRSVLVIERDGRVHETEPEALERGRVPEVLRSALEAVVLRADFDRLAARPFAGQCPVAYDGQETIYTFTTQDGPVRLASCEVEIDTTDPLFVAVDAALAAAPAPAER